MFGVLLILLRVVSTVHVCISWLLPRFMSLYHPTNLAQSKEEANTHLRSRVEAFTFLLDSGKLDEVSLSQAHSDDIIKVMDSGECGGRGYPWMS